jgi:membrane dipeptidase
LLLGRVAVIFSTLYVAPLRARTQGWDALTYADAAEAHRRYAEQLDYYEKLADEHQEFALIHKRDDLDRVLRTWEGDDSATRRVGLVLLMEGADGIREPREAEWWMRRGVRIIGLAWAGTRYAGGTGEPGPLTPEGRSLLDVMAELGLILDVSHLSDEACLEALDRFEGTLIASHAPARARVKELRRPERALTDDMIRRLAEHGGVMGVVPYNRFLDAHWQPSAGKNAVTLEHVVAMIDHVCQVTGSAAHAGLGSDFDGGFGVEAVPAEIDTVADLQKIGEALRAHGYAEADVAGVLGGNWLAVLRRGLPA